MEVEGGGGGGRGGDYIPIATLSPPGGGAGIAQWLERRTRD